MSKPHKGLWSFLWIFVNTLTRPMNADLMHNMFFESDLRSTGKKLLDHLRLILFVSFPGPRMRSYQSHHNHIG